MSTSAGAPAVLLGVTCGWRCGGIGAGAGVAGAGMAGQLVDGAQTIGFDLLRFLELVHKLLPAAPTAQLLLL